MQAGTASPRCSESDGRLLRRSACVRSMLQNVHLTLCDWPHLDRFSKKFIMIQSHSNVFLENGFPTLMCRMMRMY